ncbi:hypothetical protein CHL76_14435 [Marinococcus halophilus]|nr:hypothetical protein CHL76_14435 [Marinococcus halophilus]
MIAFTVIVWKYGQASPLPIMLLGPGSLWTSNSMPRRSKSISLTTKLAIAFSQSVNEASKVLSGLALSLIPAIMTGSSITIYVFAKEKFILKIRKTTLGAKTGQHPYK